MRNTGHPVAIGSSPWRPTSIREAVHNANRSRTKPAHPLNGILTSLGDADALGRQMQAAAEEGLRDGDWHRAYEAPWFSVTRTEVDGRAMSSLTVTRRALTLARKPSVFRQYGVSCAGHTVLRFWRWAARSYVWRTTTLDAAADKDQGGYDDDVTSI